MIMKFLFEVCTLEHVNFKIRKHLPRFEVESQVLIFVKLTKGFIVQTIALYKFRCELIK